LCSNG
jgi:hypothetical protein